MLFYNHIKYDSCLHFLEYIKKSFIKQEFPLIIVGFNNENEARKYKRVCNKFGCNSVIENDVSFKLVLNFSNVY
jgi:hypothetical protein